MKSNPSYVPAEFQQKEHGPYPSDNLIPFEEYFYSNFNNVNDLTDRSYLPIFWTSYHRNHQYGSDVRAKMRLQNFIDMMDKSKRYYTICQYDDGCMIDLSGIDIKVFSMAGEPRDFNMPLISMAHEFSYPNERRDIFASFIGKITHPLRTRLLGACSKVRNDSKDYYVSTFSHPMNEYCRILSKSIFSFCPRGYSFNSFRIQESLQYGAIPVIVSDVFYPAHGLDFNDFAVMIKPGDVYKVDKILNSISPEEIEKKQSMISFIYHTYFTFAANKHLIIKALNDGLV